MPNITEDRETKVQDIKDMFAHFVLEREWNQFHTPKNLSMALTVEAGELMELLQWVDSAQSRTEVEKRRKEVEYELADIFLYAIAFANACDIDISKAIKEKMILNAVKYPIKKSRGTFKKYTELAEADVS